MDKLITALQADATRLPGEPLTKPLAGHDGVFELRFEGDGRATFTLTHRDGEPFVIWRRIGGHDVLREP